jgi:hypothetical protein
MQRLLDQPIRQRWYTERSSPALWLVNIYSADSVGDVGPAIRRPLSMVSVVASAH